MAPTYPPPSTPPGTGDSSAGAGRYEDKFQFLTTALSSRGPAALPYAEDTKYLIRAHLLALCSAYPSVSPRAALFTHNDGRSSHLLQVDGTIPIVHAGATYNLPAVIWLPEIYPRGAPLVYLAPTREMVIKPGHPHVDRSGLVDVPYLRSWIFPASNLVDLVKSLSHLFGADPPLFTRTSLPSSSSSVSSGRVYASPVAQNQVTPSPSPSPSQSYNRFPPAPWDGKPAATDIHHTPWSGRHSSSEDPSEVFRRNATAKIVETAQADVLALRRSREVEIDALFALQSELKRREEMLSHGVKSMVDEKEALEQQLQLVLMNTDLMEDWLRGNAVKGIGEVVDAEDVFQPVDVLSTQLLECTAADMAAEDTIFALDRALQDGSVPFDGYLRSVRALAREQFFHRAMASKVRTVQAQALAANSTARAPRYAA